MKHYFTRLEDSIRKNWDKPALTNYGGKTYTFGQMAVGIEKFHILYDKIGLKKGEKVALCGKNSAEWGIAFLGSTTYEAVCVQILNDFPPESVEHLVDHSEAVILITDQNIWNKLDRQKMPNLKLAINLADYTVLFTSDRSFGLTPEDVDALYAAKFPSGIQPEEISYPKDNLDDLELINYTSGTMSSPKGVMLTYRNISTNMEYGEDGIPHIPGDTLLSLLPLAHMFGLAFDFLYQIDGGCHVYFLGMAPTPQVLVKAFSEVKPFMMLTVPLVLEKIFKRSVFPLVKKPSIQRMLKVPFLSNIIKKKIRNSIIDTFGGKMRVIIIGGAAINPEVEWWMRYVKLPYTVGYGMTECGPLVGYKDTKKFVLGSCGACVDRMQIRVDSEDPQHIVGEIQMKGDPVMIGYYKNEEATKATFTEDGWLKSGDLGLIDKGGNIFLKGRSKNMILTSNGQNVYPEEIEERLNSQPYVVESVVLERDKQIVALVFPDQDRISQEQLDTAGVADIMERNRININLLLPVYSRISRIEVMDNEFEKTPKKSIKRYLYK
jgi:Long-chain acyl-CoA synthetases (AMP-forming)